MKQSVSYLMTGIFFIFFNVATAQTATVAQLITEYQADRGALLRKYSNPLSEEYFDRFDRFYGDWLTQLSNIRFDALSHHEQADYLLFENHLEKSRYFHQQDWTAYKEVVHVVSFAEPLLDFVKARRTGQTPRAERLATSFHEMADLADALQKQLSMGKPFNSWQQAELAANVVNELHTSVKEAHGFYQGYHPGYSWWMAHPADKLLGKLASYAQFIAEHYENTLAKDDGSGIIGRPIGREAIARSLAFEFIDYSPEELIREAEKQYAWCEAEMRKASAEMGHGDDWRTALEEVKNRFFPPGEWPQEIHRMANEAIDFVEERNLITVPKMAKETWRMRMLTAEEQKFSPFFLGGESILIAYPTDQMPHQEKMMSLRGNNPHFARAVVHHELIPGHHLQQFMNQRHQIHRRMFYTPFWTEGWALYWEFNLWDKGFPRSAEDKIGMLFWRMHRCARIVFSLNYHLGNMAPQACIDYLVDKVGHERANAEAEVRRSFMGRYGPLYQIAYMVGGLQFYALHKELVGSAKMTEKEMHDAVLQNNSIPVALVRALLLQHPLTKSGDIDWRFLD